MFGLNIALFFSGVDRTPIAHAEFISALTPLVMVPLTAFMLKERVPRPAIIAGVCALAGVTLILSRSPSGHTGYLGDLMVLPRCRPGSRTCSGRSPSGGGSARRSSWRRCRWSPASRRCRWPSSTGGGPAGLIDLTPQGWILGAALAISTGMVAHGLIAWSQGKVELGTMSLVQLVQPGLGALWGALFLSESVAPIQLVGIAIVLVSVGAIVRSSSRPPDAPVRVRRQRSLVAPSPSPACSLRSSSSS